MLISKLPFIWYDDINYQNRYKEYCGVCDYKLITSPTNMLPFQIRTLSSPEEDVPSVIPQWFIYCSDGVLYAQLDISNLIINVVDGMFYITYQGDTLIEYGTLNPITLPCGSYYSRIEQTFGLTQYNFYSEIFEVVDFTQTFLDYEITTALFLPFRWYETILKQNRYKEYCEANCGYCLITTPTALLPFQIRTPFADGVIAQWDIFCSDGALAVQADPVDALFQITLDGFVQIFYQGNDLNINGTTDPLVLPCGEYYSVIHFVNGITDYTFYSEIFCVKDDIDTYGNDFLQTDGGVNLTNDDGIQLTID